ncbi:hypothetical protein TWF694_007914 [Orbilia ellipsospora]|uniref:Uncharacterized protein n=1 Tax=Orbilia ellipsospora TaxID=2528407 RepID=A0AAV9XQT8_9PEZI
MPNLGTGALTAICDWRDTEITPFGMSLGGLETMLGINRAQAGAITAISKTYAASFGRPSTSPCRPSRMTVANALKLRD